jgi:ATP-binding cassette subfamily B protein
MMFLNFRLALISFLTIPLIFLAIFFLGKRMRKAYKGVREKLAELNADVEESISGIRIVQALNREAINTGKFKRLSWENLKANLKAVSYFALLFPTMTLSRVFGESLVLMYGGWQVVNDVISLGVIIAFLSYVRRFFGPLADLSQVYNTYQSAGASLDRIYEYISIQPSIREQEKSIKPDNEFKGEINFEEVSFGYDEQQTIINGFNLHIDPGEVFALVGATGAGKTTIVNLLTRLYDVVQGSILIDGVDLRQIPFKELRKLIAVVPQNVFLFDTSVKENIRYGAPKAKDEEVEMAAKRVHSHDFITNLPDGYETEVGEGGVRLSGGQRQLISFARALIADPKILILDEAISSVDAYTEVLIQKALEELLKDRTAIIIAHRFSTLRRADRIGVLRNGSLIGIGRHEELMQSNSIYRELFQKQTGAEA